MARPKKEDTVSKKSKKKIVEESDEEVEDVVVKKSKKVPKPKSKKQVVDETDELDELSDLDVDEENNDEVVSTSESQAKKNVDKKPTNTNTYQQPQTYNNNNSQRRPFEPRERKVINPQTPICELKIDEIFTYLIQYGKDNCNPSLIEMMSQNLRDITGRGRSYSNNNRSGSKSNRGGGSKSNRGYYNGGGRGRPYQNQTEGFSQNPNQGPNTGYRQRSTPVLTDQAKKPSVTNNEDLYNDQ